MSPYEDRTLSPDAFLGWTIAIVMACSGWLLALWPFWEIGAAGNAALETFPQRIGSWSDDRDWAMIGLFLPVLPLLILPGAFGSTWKTMIPDQPWRIRCALMGGLAGAILLGALVSRASFGHRLGVGEPAGVTWLVDGKVTETRPWTAARDVRTTCRMVSHRHAPSTPDPDYAVAFDGHGPADLSRTSSERTSAWIARVTPLDAQLRAAGIPRRATDVDPECLKALGEDLTPGEVQALRTLLVAP